MCGEPFIDQLITNDNGNDQDAREYEELSEEYLKHMREQEWLLERLGAECDDDEVEEEKPDVDVFFDNFDQQKLTEAEQAARVHTFIIYFVTYSMRRLGIPPEVPRLTELTKFADWAVQTMQFLVAMLELPEVVIIIVDLMRDVMFGPGQAEFVDELMSVQAGAEGIREALDGARDAQPQEEVNVGWVPYPQRHSA